MEVEAETWSPNEEEQEHLLPKRIQHRLKRESTNNKKGEDNKKCDKPKAGGGGDVIH